MQSGISISREPKMKIQEPLSNQTLIKSNDQLWHEDQDQAPQAPPIHVEMPIVNQILASLESLREGMSSMQWVVHSIDLRVEQCQLDIQECLQHHHPARDEEDHPTLAEED